MAPMACAFSLGASLGARGMPPAPSPPASMAPAAGGEGPAPAPAPSAPPARAAAADTGLQRSMEELVLLGVLLCVQQSQSMQAQFMQAQTTKNASTHLAGLPSLPPFLPVAASPHAPPIPPP